jgi:hypothetical protein
MVPHGLAAQVALQVTAVFEAPFTVAVNCSVPPDTTVAVVGAMETETFGATVTVAEADFDVSAAEVATTVTDRFDVTVGEV